MAQYVYPAVFTKEENAYTVTFPDIEDCFTFGKTLNEAIVMAADALCLMLYTYEEDGTPINPPSNAKDIEVDENSIVNLVACDTIEYRIFNDNKSVKKTLSIPNWLNKMSEREGINFSQVLQEALIAKIEHRY